MKESLVLSDLLLTIDLKSGPKVTLGTHVITLEKFSKVPRITQKSFVIYSRHEYIN